MMEYAVSIENLNLWISGRQILYDISLRVPINKITVIIGPSGGGKSTLLKTVNRLIDLYKNVKYTGKIVVLGRDTRKWNPYDLRRAAVYVSQTPNPFPHMSIYENIALGPVLHNMVKDKEELDQLVRWALEKAMLWDEVKDRLDEKPGILSGGQQQRLCIARALALKPKILLLDEPTANIDPENTEKIEEVLRSLCRELTVVLVTHDHGQAERLADKLIHMKRGRIVVPSKIQAV